MARFFTHLRSNAVAYLALFFALAGTSYAAASLPANSVGTKQLKRSAVTASKIKKGSLTAKLFANGQLPKGPTGATGPAASTAFAWISSSGTLLGGKGVSSVSYSGTGNYTVFFNEDVGQCVALGTLTAASSAGSIRTQTTSGPPSYVAVFTNDSGGFPADRYFYLAVIC